MYVIDVLFLFRLVGFRGTFRRRGCWALLQLLEGGFRGGLHGTGQVPRLGGLLRRLAAGKDQREGGQPYEDNSFQTRSLLSKTKIVGDGKRIPPLGDKRVKTESR